MPTLVVVMIETERRIGTTEGEPLLADLHDCARIQQAWGEVLLYSFLPPLKE